MGRPSKSFCDPALMFRSSYSIYHRRKISQAEKEGESNSGEDRHECNRLFDVCGCCKEETKLLIFGRRFGGTARLLSRSKQRFQTRGQLGAQS